MSGEDAGTPRPGRSPQPPQPPRLVRAAAGFTTLSVALLLCGALTLATGDLAGSGAGSTPQPTPVQTTTSVHTTSRTAQVPPLSAEHTPRHPQSTMIQTVPTHPNPYIPEG